MPFCWDEIVAAEDRDVESTVERAPSWSWGTAQQLFACRLSQALGLVAVLAMLLLLGWAPGH